MLSLGRYLRANMSPENEIWSRPLLSRPANHERNLPPTRSDAGFQVSQKAARTEPVVNVRHALCLVDRVLDVALDGALLEHKRGRDDERALRVARELAHEARDQRIRQVLDDLIADHEVEARPKLQRHEIALHKGNAGHVLPDAWSRLHIGGDLGWDPIEAADEWRLKCSNIQCRQR